MVAGIPIGDEITTDKFGVIVPKNYSVMDTPDVVFIPLIACDKNKNRIGFGKGYYDKFLQNRNCIKVGICYDFQVVANITPNATDIPLDIIVTESEIIK
jgi:5-formyltetrahydrofolate cyclo-ligase